MVPDCRQQKNIIEYPNPHLIYRVTPEPKSSPLKFLPINSSLDANNPTNLYILVIPIQNALQTLNLPIKLNFPSYSAMNLEKQT